jgi:hypothetical protein
MVRLSPVELRRFHPELFGMRGWVTAVRDRLRRGIYGYSRLHLAEWLYHGDSRAAVVLSTGPHIVAAYTDELDCVVLLRFPDELAQEYGSRIGSRLLTANTYEWRSAQRPLKADLWDGPRSYRRHANLYPLIAEFLSDDRDRIEQRKSEIPEEEWARAYDLGVDLLSRGRPARDGRPLNCGKAAVGTTDGGGA